MKTMLTGWRDYLEAGISHQHPHVIFPLRGKFKGETGDRNHLMVCVAVSNSGINVKIWVERLLRCIQEIGRKESGYLFATRNGTQRKVSHYNPQFHDHLREVMERQPGLFPKDLDVASAFSLTRSLRRGSTTAAQNLKVDVAAIELNNRWRKVERAQGRAPNLSMRQHYSQLAQMLDARLRYSESF